MSDSAGDRLHEYHKFVGWFISQYANLEDCLRRLLLQHTGMSVEMFAITIGFPRTSDAINKLRKVIALNQSLDPDSQAALADAFGQLDLISKLRDRIVHYGGHPINTGEFLVRSKPSDKSRETGEPYDLFDKQELWSAASDLFTIQNVFNYRLGESELPNQEVNGVRREPWRYTPPGQRQNPR